MPNSLKSGSVVIQRRGKTYAGEYVVARGMITVCGENGSKTAQLGGASAETMATDLLREIVDENKAAFSTFRERWRDRILGRIDRRH
jgi:hypothetical protein